MSKKIVFKINREGNVAIDEVIGYGSCCLEATKMLEGVLGGVDEGSRQMTEEFNNPIACDREEHIEH